MFGIFKKTIHEPAEQQKRDVAGYPDTLRDMVLSGESCDTVSGAFGDFGRCPSNPIPVNGIVGTYKYFSKLHTPIGSALFFHRICSVDSSVIKNPVDVYETVSMDGTLWDAFFFDFYHPRRSNLAPSGYRLVPYDKRTGDLPFAFGIDKQLRNFPHDLPAAIANSTHLGEPFARRARERIAKTVFHRPAEHIAWLKSMKVAPSTVSVVDPDSGTVFYP